MNLTRSSFSMRELDGKPVDLERQNLNKFLQAIKSTSPAVFKEIKDFVYEKERSPFCNEVHF